MTHAKHLTFLCCFCLFCTFDLEAQSTPEDLGRFIFESIQQDSISKIDRLIPTVDDMKKIAEQLGISKDSKQYAEMLKGREVEITEFHENLNLVYSDTLDNGLKWQMARLEKINKVIDTIQVDNQNPNSKRAPIATVRIYFTSNSNRFFIVLNDVFPEGDLWKTGSSIYMKKLK